MSFETSKPEPPSLWFGQGFHFACLAGLLVALFSIWIVLGRPFPAAFWIAAGFPVFHQVYTWLAWRLELQSSATSKTIGFRGYLIVFFLLFGGRFISLAFLAYLDRGSLGLAPDPRMLITSILLVPGLYAIYSVKRYFGMARAAGGDHFEQRFRDMPLVEDGIFRFTRNGMYLYAFLLFWGIAICLNSLAALTVAAFSHAYIWVHFHAIEKPDMKFLYASKQL
jgi:protein-S-isoprenylcysteine O-methyltransferase Ste14